jgi:serralysin
MVPGMTLRRAGLALVMVAASLAWAGPARAAEDNDYGSGSTLRYTADPGAQNNVVIRLVGDEFVIDDTVAIEPGFNCKHRSADLTVVHCASYGITIVWVETFDLNDTVDYLAAVQSVVRAGDGHDTVWGGAGVDVLWGEAGNDCLNGWSGDDRPVGGIGTDRLLGGPGTDVCDLGPGGTSVSGCE